MAGGGDSWHLVNDRLFQAGRSIEGELPHSPFIAAWSKNKLGGGHSKPILSAFAEVAPADNFNDDEEGDFWDNISSNGTSAVLTPSDPELPPDQLSFYSNPKYHVHVLATLISTAMKLTGYVPGSSQMQGQSASAAAAETQAFVMFLTKLGGYAQYITTVESDSRMLSNEEKNCDKLIATIKKFMDGAKDLQVASKADILSSMIDTVKDVAQALSTQRENVQARTCFKQFNIVGSKAVNPCVGIYFSSVQMQTSDPGITKPYVQSSKFVIYRVTYELNSVSVAADAQILAAAKITEAQKVAEEINKANKQPPN